MPLPLSARLCAALLFALASAPSASATPATGERAVLLISIDGLHPSYILDAERLGVRAPVLREIARSGAHAQGVTNVSPTVTYPNHTALVTGTGPRENGIYTNTVFDPLGHEQGAWNWYGSQIQSPTLWDAAKAAGMVTGSVLWPVSVHHPAIDYNVPEYWRTKKTASDRYVMEAVSTPSGFLEQVEKDIGPFYAGSNENEVAMDEKIVGVATAMIEKARPRLLTVHIVTLDGAQHEDGPLPVSEKSRRVLEKIDALVGRLVAAERKAYPQATVAIASDHGFLPVDHLINLNAALAKAGLVEFTEGPAPKVKSWKAYAWNSGGSSSVVLADPADAAVRAQVGRILHELAADPASGIAAVLDGEQAVAAGALPDAAFVVDSRSGYAMGGALTGEVVTRTEKTIGTHGYLNSHPEMNSSFFIQGPGIGAGRNLGQVDIRRIAPTLARELGVQLPGATQEPLPLRD
ncbi:MAG: alkaline phosphatase family protein [Pseudoxanthomonas sp.]|nr:alkaline phosphatase family protein [Pseudoxanthomonas sp.]